MKPTLLGLGLGSLILSAGCGDNLTPQTVTGRVAQGTFPAQVTAVRVANAGGTITEVPMTPGGHFRLELMPARGVRLELVTAAGAPRLVFPRATGALELAFDLVGSDAPFDLGAVRYIGDPAAQGYVFAPPPAEGGDGDGECEDGIDPTTGAVCVDDDAGEGEQCGEHEDGEADDGEADDDGETDDDQPTQAAVADHNLPGTMGCGDGDGEQDDDGEEQD